MLIRQALYIWKVTAGCEYVTDANKGVNNRMELLNFRCTMTGVTGFDQLFWHNVKF